LTSRKRTRRKERKSASLVRHVVELVKVQMGEKLEIRSSRYGKQGSVLEVREQPDTDAAILPGDVKCCRFRSMIQENSKIEG